MRSEVRRIGLVLALTLVGAPPARAQPDEYRALIEEAVSEFAAQRFAEARALFRQAHEIDASARTLRGIGLSSFEMRDYPEAIAALRAALAHRRRPLDPEQREEALEVIARARRFVGAYVVERPPDAELRVDGAVVELAAGAELILPLGRYVVSVHRPGHRPSSAAIDVLGGEEETLALHPASVSEPSPEPEPREPAPSATGPIVLLVTGAGLAIAAIVAGVLWWERDAELTICDARCTNEPGIRLERDLAAGSSIGAAVLGVGALALGAVLLGLGERELARVVASFREVRF